MGTSIRLPFLKYSWARGEGGDNSPAWRHIIADDLFLFMHGDDERNTQLTMQVVQRNTKLETLDVSTYIDHAAELQHRARQSGTALPPERLPIFGMTRDAILALRYRISDGQDHRMQMRMRTVAECQRVVTLLVQRGMHFSQQKVRSGRPGTKSSDDRLLTASASAAMSYISSAQPATLRPNPFKLPPLEAGSLSRHHDSSPPRPESHHCVSTISTSPATQSSFFITRDEQAAPRALEPTRPTTAQIFRPQNSGMPPPASATPTYRPQTSQLEPPVLALRANSSAGTSDSQQAQSASTTSAPLAAPKTYLERPASALSAAPLLPTFPDTLEHEIPPRRELPFKRPQSARSSGDRLISRPPSSALRPQSAVKLSPPKTSAGPASPCAISPQMPPKTSAGMTLPFGTVTQHPPALPRPSSSSPLKRAWDADGSTSDAPPPTDTSETSVNLSPLKKQRGLPVIDPDAPRLGPMDQLLARTRPLTERSPNVKSTRMDSLADAPHEVVSPPQTSSGRQRPVEATGDFTIQPLQGAQPITANDEVAGLAAYASQSREDRAAALDEFMISKLEDPSFTTLCGDVENCWRRIALGL